MDNRKKALAIINDQLHFDEGNIFELLRLADDEYTNDGETFISDSEYDMLRLIAQSSYPTHEYFLGVGSSVRVDKVKLPYVMGSLDQVQIGEICSWVTKRDLVGKSFVVSDKMDGISVLLVYNYNGELQIALTRGDGFEGQDITRHVKQIPSVPKKVLGKMSVRAEIEYSNSNFEAVKKIATRKDGSEYKNPRNAVGGMMNNKTIPPAALKLLDVFAYDIMGSDESKLTQLQKLTKNKFTVVNYTVVGSGCLNDKFLSEHIEHRKSKLDYEIDGIVIDVSHSEDRQRLAEEKKRDSINPAYSIKYKVTDSNNHALATVRYVEWNVSKHGKAKPRVKLVPFDLQGVTIEHTTGFNAKYILDNNIGKDTILKITRSGDVIPYILSVETSTTADMPENIEDYEWNDTNVDLVLKDKTSNSDVILKRLTSWATALDIPNLKEGSIKKLVDEGYDTPAKIVNMTSDQLKTIIGKNGEKIAKGLVDKFSTIHAETLLGSYPSFGVGVGVRKFKMLVKALGCPLSLLNGDITKQEIVDVDGFDTKTAEIILDGLPEFLEYYKDIKPSVGVITAVQKSASNKFSGKRICFTGFRNKEWQEIIEACGGEVASGVSKKTDLVVANDPDAVSGKTSKARDLGVDIISKEEFEGMIADNPTLSSDEISESDRINKTIGVFFE